MHAMPGQALMELVGMAHTHAAWLLVEPSTNTVAIVDPSEVNPVEEALRAR